jgi:hypothetical protein
MQQQRRILVCQANTRHHQRKYSRGQSQHACSSLATEPLNRAQSYSHIAPEQTTAISWSAGALLPPFFAARSRIPVRRFF